MGERALASRSRKKDEGKAPAEANHVHVPAATRRALRERLRAWYAEQQRALPWRAVAGQPANPYHVLVSEFMLQQTQVATVIAYFQRFIARFPTVAELAAAEEQEVLRLWQGLGYYRRARQLHAAARKIVAEHGGAVPGTVAALRELPGVGPYCAGAIASIGFDVATPLVDGNVQRVLARWFAITELVNAPATTRELWEIAAQLVPEERPGDFNQGLMELGAMVCTPRQPACLLCPVQAVCQAHQTQRVAEIPAKLPRAKPRAVTHHVLHIQAEGKILFQRRPDRGLWSRMWQMPTAEELGDAVTGAALVKWARETLGVALRRAVEAGAFTHQTTHRTIRFVVWTAEVGKAGGAAANETLTWRRVDQIEDLPLANPQRRALTLVAGSTSG